MIHVLIAEDEPPTLRRIQAMVEQLDPAFSVVATALNGREALLRLAEVHVDVVLTDIRMPVMNGMELMDRISAQYPDCMTVVLSGYQDFEYISHAIRARSLDYLLKPVSADALRTLLSRVKEQYLRMSRERLSRSLAAQLNKAAPDDGNEHADDTGLGVCLFCAGGLPHGEDAEMHPGLGQWSGKPLEALAQQIVPGFTSFSWEFMGNTPVERILIFQTEQDRHEPWVKCLHETLLDHARLPISCACLSGGVHLNQVNAELKRLRGALRRNIRIGHSLFLCLPPQSDAPDEAPAKPDDGETALKLKELLASGRMSQANPFRRELFQRMEREGWTQQRVTELFLLAASAMERDERADVRRAARQYRTVLPDAISAALSLKELESDVCSLEPPADGEAASVLVRQSEVVDAVERYLKEHYTEHITNQTLAAEFGYVPSYLSVLFRQRYKLSPSEYLTQVRIGEAKKLMRTKPDILVREVAERVGFKSQHHFSRIFKKTEGMWPSSYQS